MPLDTLSDGERRTLRGWLRALEAFCRRLALTEALALVLPDRAPASRPTCAGPHTTRRRPALRLWPKLKRPHARIRVLGAATSVREIEAARRRDALIARLGAGRARRKPPHLRIADRIEALQRFLDAPAATIRRFARKLRAAPSLAVAIVARRAPACPYLAPDQVADCATRAYGAVSVDSS